MKYVLYAILAYFLYQFIFNLVIPVYRATRRFKKGVREMQTRVEEENRKRQEYFNWQKEQYNNSRQDGHKAGDYIDFEEVK